jgi:hypothetical protein
MSIRELARLLRLAACLLLPCAAAAEESGWRDAMDRLAREKTLAESCVSILKTFAENDLAARFQGQKLYAQAKADVDGLITLLQVDLVEGTSPADHPSCASASTRCPASAGRSASTSTPRSARRCARRRKTRAAPGSTC